MKTLDRPLDDHDRAMADLAEVSDWTGVCEPGAGETGPAMVRALIKRVTAATGWRPWPIKRDTVIDEALDGWGFITRRSTEMAVYGDQILPHSPFAGWAAYAIGSDDITAAEAGLDQHWPATYAMARRHWGEPAYVGTDSRASFVNEWRPAAGFDRRHLAVWVRRGATFHLYSNKPTKDPVSVAVGFNYTVYLKEEAT